jgi:glycosyltransferase involved in cell wall biosynthesis
MAAGVPVVSTAAGSLAEVLGEAALVVPVGDADALSAAVVEVLTDAEVGERLAAAGRAWSATYSWPRCAAGLHGLYQLAARAR